MTRRFTGRRPLVLGFGSIAASGLMLTGCGEPAATDAVFDTAAQCIESGVNADICNAEYQEALQRHVRDAPKFNGQAACEAEYGEGRCLETPAAAGTAGTGTGSFFVPFMTGYLISSAISNLGSYGAYRSYRRDSQGYNPVPIYRNRAGSTFRSDPPAIGQAPQQRPFNVNTRTVARQGFGGSAATRGFSFGG